MKCILMLSIACLGLVDGVACAQSVTVQQPVVGQFSTATTVSVPDRGQAFVAGVSRAADGQNRTFGFLPSSNYGTSQSDRSVSTSVFIHDLQEIDRQLLSGDPRASIYQTAEVGPSRFERPATVDINPVYRTQRQRNRDVDTSPAASSTAEPRPHASRVHSLYLRKANAAEENGNKRLAEYYRSLAETLVP